MVATLERIPKVFSVVCLIWKIINISRGHGGGRDGGGGRLGGRGVGGWWRHKGVGDESIKKWRKISPLLNCE